MADRKILRFVERATFTDRRFRFARSTSLSDPPNLDLVQRLFNPPPYTSCHNKSLSPSSLSVIQGKTKRTKH